MRYRTGPTIVFCLIGSLLAADDTETTGRQTRMAAMRLKSDIQLNFGAFRKRTSTVDAVLCCPGVVSAERCG